MFIFLSRCIIYFSASSLVISLRKGRTEVRTFFLSLCFVLLVLEKDICSHVLRVSYVSPRKRAQRTFELLNLGIKDPLPWHHHGACPDELETNYCNARVQVTEDIREWDCEFVLCLSLPSLKAWH